MEKCGKTCESLNKYLTVVLKLIYNLTFYLWNLNILKISSTLLQL